MTAKSIPGKAHCKGLVHEFQEETDESLTLTDLRRAEKLRRGGIAKLLRTRSTPIINSDVQEPLTRYKTLVNLKTRWPFTFHRYHLDDGITVQDQDCIVHSARDELFKGIKGLQNRSSGIVCYSHDSMERMILDTNDILRIIVDKPPNSRFRLWKVTQLEKEFRNRWGRAGIWWDNKLQFSTFLSCFQKTFEVFGENNCYVRLRHPWSRNTLPPILDCMAVVMTRIARLKKPELTKFQKAVHLNTEDVKGAYDPGVKNNLFKSNLWQKRILAPVGCWESEEKAIYEALGIVYERR